MMIPLLPTISLPTTPIVDSGPISAHLPTGIAITSFQQAAIQIVYPQKYFGRRFFSASFTLDSSLCLNNSSISISLCKELVDTQCLEAATFPLPQSKQKINAEWRSKLNPLLYSNIYWLIIGGNAKTFDHSFSWLDADNFTATEAFSSENGASWTVLQNVKGASTLVFVVQ